MTITAALLANYKTKYGGFFDALPEINTLAELLPLMESRPEPEPEPPPPEEDRLPLDEIARRAN